MEAKMAQRVTVELEDDLDGGPAVETLRFGLVLQPYFVIYEPSPPVVAGAGAGLVGAPVA
jgi:hypothetical protein